jgi:hypothetical protein
MAVLLDCQRMAPIVETAAAAANTLIDVARAANARSGLV